MRGRRVCGRLVCKSGAIRGRAEFRDCLQLWAGRALQAGRSRRLGRQFLPPADSLPYHCHNSRALWLNVFPLGPAMFVRTLSLVLSMLPLLAAFSAEARALLSHRAVYSLSTGALESGSSVAEVSGRLVVEAREECDGYILNQRIVTRTTSTQGQETLSDLRIALWESRNGLEMHFSIASHIDGRLVQEDNGSAELQGEGDAGTATFKAEEPQVMSLPAGTIFPTTHNMGILRTAREGGHVLPTKVFDGSAQDGPYDTYTVIGRPRGDSVEAARGQPLLKDVESWPIRTSYYLLDQSEAEPDFEIGYNLFDNGVAGDLMLDYGDFAIAGRLQSLEALPQPVCTE